ncbi:MAG: DUF692 family protein [Anaerolineae bacterium]|nr:DUF692 family protein [Anaerolineae bacterium]
MKLAVNYSLPCAELVERGRIDFDLYKTTEWAEMIEAAEAQRPAYVHFPFHAGRQNMESVGLEQVENLLATTATPYVNTHIAPRASDFGMDMRSTDETWLERLIPAMMADIEALTSFFGTEQVILENANYDPNYDIPILTIQPALIRRLVDETGCGLLLDLAHARMAAHYFGMETQAYIEQLPLYALCELHVAGTRYDDEQQRLVDHYPMTEVDWETTEWALQNIHAGEWPEPRIVALEYGGTGSFFSANSDPLVLKTDVPRLYKLVQGMGITSL